MKKKLSILLCFLLLVTMLAIPAAADSGAAWDGSIDTSWYNTTDTSFEISKPEQLAGLARIVAGKGTALKKDNFKGKTVELTADLDLGGVKSADGTWSGPCWYPIGSGYSNSFAGTFLGNGHKISNLYFNKEDSNHTGAIGLFSYVAKGARVEGIQIVSGYLVDLKGTIQGGFGAISGELQGLIIDCHNSADIKAGNLVGGIVGSNTGTVEKCSNSGSISSIAGKPTGSAFGGICGQARATGGSGSFGGNLYNCYNTGTVDITTLTTATANTGGLAGSFGSYGGNMNNCYNAGKVLINDKVSRVGALIGADLGGTKSNNYFLKTETVNSTFNSAGAVDEATLKAAAKTLGSAYCDDTTNANGGFPRLKWELTGKPEADEAESIQIASAELTDSAIVLTLDRYLYHTTLTANDFTMTASAQVPGDEARELKLTPSISTTTNADKTAMIVTLSFAQVRGTYKDQNLTVKVAYKDGTPTEKTIVIPASDLWVDFVASAYAGGSGTATDPYQIETAEQLALLAYNVNIKNQSCNGLYFVQTADIDLAKSSTYGVALRWNPIGSTAATRFYGSYDGQNYKISNMNVVSCNTGMGLFGITGRLTASTDPYFARVINVTLENVLADGLTGTEQGNANVGTLIGQAEATDITNCHVLSGTVKGGTCVGGLVGWYRGSYEKTQNFKMSGCSSAADVYGYSAGGLVGAFSNGTRGPAGSPTNYANISMVDCYATGDVTFVAQDGIEANHIGGLIGDATMTNTSSVQNCYATGTLKAEGKVAVGGLIGNVGTSEEIFNRPAVLNINGNVVLVPSMSGLHEGYYYGRVGGLETGTLADVPATFKNNYVLSTMLLDGAAFNGEAGDNANGTSKTAKELAKRSTWEELGFDLSDSGLWSWSDALSRPVLRGEKAVYEITVAKQPVNSTAYADKTAMFVTVAERGAGDFSYTWQRSEDNGKTWKDIKTEESAARLDLAAKLRWDGNLIRCKITDVVGTVAYSDDAVLHVSSNDYDVKTAANELYAYYKASTITNPKTPASLYSLKGDVSDFNILIHYLDTYDELKSGTGRGLPAWAVIDSLVSGGDPTHYVKTSSVSSGAVTVDLIDEYLQLQNATGNGAFITTNGSSKKDGIMSNIIYTLAMDMYFDGGEWGNENEAGTTGRTAAFNYLMSQLKDDTKTSGRYYESLTSANGDYGAKYALRYNAEFVILMSRFVDDEQLGKQANAAMRDVMECLQWQYQNDKMKDSPETVARYASALVAAINVTDSKSLKASYQKDLDTIFDKLTEAKTLTGGYYKTFTPPFTSLTSTVTDDADATAAVMMALGDMMNGKAVLAEFSVRMSDEEVINADFGRISLVKMALSDLTLPQTGALGTQFTWSSSNEDVIAPDGTVTRPEADTIVTLTVTGTYGEATLTHEFTVTVPMQREAGGDEVYADLENLDILPEYIHDIALPTSGENGSAITWTSSNEAVITSEGTVIRPAIGQEDAIITLTATAACGDATQTRDFTIKVWANVDTSTNDGMVKEGYYLCRENFMNMKTLHGYWDVYAAYAALGDQIRDFDYIYDTSINSESQIGAHILAIVALGENPYNYQGTDFVAKLRKNGLGGQWSIPVFSTLAADAAGIMLSEGEASSRSAAYEHLTILDMGPDIGGWAGAAASRVLATNERVREQATYYCTQLASSMSGASMGSSALSMGCVMTALTAFLAEDFEIDGIAGMDVTKDEPWVSQNPVKEVYMVLVTGSQGSFSVQPAMELCDLYNVKFNNGHVGWIACGVSKARVDEQVALANEILANKALYTEESISAIETALEKVKGISEERLNARIPDYGAEYYELYDAVRYVQTNEGAQADQAAADAVAALIDALPAAEEITADNAEAVEAARAAYDALTEAQQSLVSEEAVAKLEAAEAKLAELEADAAAVNAVAAMIEALPTVDALTLDDQAAVEAARAAYDALTEAQQSLVSEETLAALEAAEARLAELAVPEELPFTDLTQDWYKDSVRFVYENGLMVGTSDTTFGPDDALTRGMFVTMLYRMEGEPEVNGSCTFSDVAAGMYYEDAIIWANANGVVYGEGGKFNPNGEITREQMAAMMRRYAEFCEVDTTARADLSVYTDGSTVSSWFTEDMQWAVAAELLYGDNHSQLNPTKNATRAEAAAILQRFAQKLAD